MHATSELAICYMYGWGAPVDYERAMLLARHAADMGNATAMCTCGLLYMVGRGVKTDASEAVRWYERAIAAGIREKAPLENLRRYAAVGLAEAKEALRRLGLE